MLFQKYFFIFTLLFSSLQANDMISSMTNQGFTGLINTPNAGTMQEGDLTFHFDNQFDNALKGYDYKKPDKGNENYIFGAGLFSFIEIQGRLSETPGYHRDLSANLKVKLPYTHKYLPNFAIGAQDIGSAANFYGNYYGVMDKEFWFVRASLGYGYSTVENEKRKRMDGLFGGLEVKTFDWLYFLVEDDSVEQFAGVRIHMPKSWTSYFKLNTLISTNITQEYATSVSVNLSFPLYENIKSYSANSVKTYTQEVAAYRVENKEDIGTKVVIPKVEIKKTEIPKISLQEIKKRFTDLGLENISLATKEETIYVAYENNVFLFNELDAIGVIVGTLNESNYKYFILEPKHSKTTLFALSGDLDKAREFYNNPSSLSKAIFTASLQKTLPIKLENYTFNAREENDTQFKLRVEFSPVVRTFVGNEFGMFNYKLWLRTKLQVNLYKSIDITAVGDIHINDSQIDDNRYDWFLKLYEKGSSIQSLMLHYNTNLLGGINTLSLGTFEELFIGGIDQYIYNYENHTIKLKGGYFSQFQDGDPYKEKYLGKKSVRYFFMAKYSYLFEDYDTFAEINAGQYWNQDLGFDLKLKRYFGDVAVSLTYEQSKTMQDNSLLSESTDKYVGIALEIPLTLRHTPSFKYGQIRGTNSFEYKLRSTIAREDGTNNLVLGGNYNPKIALDSQDYFYNRNRLQLSYLKTHAFRFIESYEKYTKK
ncbi:YjbH domain-containing protein [Sulfurimonas sp. SAG-AH-194-C21]|nr:YjbH domain-containing protein [Sulfurimonas sp. SAG-AH-194-C21]MDF1882964.1 YjbH domain-containing protein [Sulfurimonas sp. SAG-AH-194-C21]